MPADFSEVRELAVDLGVSGVLASRKVQQILSKTAHDIESTAKQLAAVDTGTMRNSIGVDIRPLQATVGPTVNYAPYVEFGTSRQAPQPFMGPALDRHSHAFYAALDAIGVPGVGG